MPGINNFTRTRQLSVFLLLLASGGCSSLADAPLIGLPANTPARPAQSGAFPAVHDIPPPRTSQTLSPAEQTKIEAELVQVRARQKSTAATDAAAIAKANRPAKRRVESPATK